ncbi:MAG TPA: LacI family DNA-binding transcriptional regulator [Aggregatilinea sp.]|uniref:LacI family DNA-binding transcriptional regulator n=1 Tax=Aggregatilinea sp. TaxID=2806333 RepID=UPI002C32D8EF|nr:LacI family DNA-binding transcriptional regulator [Aggregatilinea sp.]HML21643.1 LacI family DNA-binding transcriptional regulator [Aggregatilinea sp.]
MTKRVTIKDVAEHAGTSYQTVSRVLNNKADVAAETRARVLASIKALNYRPSMAARLLGQDQDRTFTIANIIPYYDVDFVFGNDHLMQTLHGIDLEATLRGYSLLLSTAHSAGDPASSYARLLERQMVDGIIFESGLGEDGAEELVERGYKVVISGYTTGTIPCVRSDDESGTYVLTQHLLALGHRHIGVIMGPESAMPVHARWRGYERAMRDAALDPRHTPRAQGHYTFEGGYDAAAQLMRSHSYSLTALLAFNDAMAIGAMRWLQEHGYAVPGDMSVAGFDDIPIAQYQTPSLTTIRLQSVEAGRRLAQTLFDILDGRPLSTTRAVIPTELKVRGSTSVPRRIE